MDPLIRKKVVFIGDATVGKTSLISRFMYDEFYNNYNVTIGTDFHSKIITTNQKLRLRLQLLDIGSSIKYHSIISSYVSNVNVCVLVYDITNQESFINVQQWFKELQEIAITRKIQFYLVGNKIDLSSQESVPIVQAKSFADSNNMKFICTSALSSMNISSLFSMISDGIIDNELVQQGLDAEMFEEEKRWRCFISSCSFFNF
ncbi:hypothetical protein, conserved [Entamoeba dispar SAW760]|uniref:Uncharacterized protein n=1 Tax=Entamoeba dispar (strain ATCC PRA-260 / SAW760) TaxID=370354 RepID=B0E7I8_ENTDS|nr:uncharacterized protein EDI_349550 [Entamoeba dispar SAW760]EDR29516.1 hypothetical protein, conserved [Entamoeba dispar SAW760]|eukprot:EDR29516.1 hypothetical protein, conserved [Entamoeba dispar SAW760]